MAGNQFKIKIGAEFDSSGLDAAIRKSVNKKYTTKVNIDVDTKSIVSKLKSTYKQMNSLKRQQIKLDVDSSEYKTLDAEINRLIQRASTLQSRLSGNLPNNIFDDIVEESTRAEAAIKRVESSIVDATKKQEQKIAEARKQQTANITKQIDNGTFTRSLKEMESSIGNLKNPNLLAGNLRNLREAYQALGNLGPIVDDESFNKAKIAVDRYNDALTETRNRYKILKSQQDQVNSSIQSDNAARSLENAKKTLSLRIDNWLNSNSAAEAQFGDRLRDIQGRITNINNSADLSALRSEFTQTTLEAKNADVAMMSFGDRLKRQAREYMSYVGIAGLVMAGSQAFRQMAQNVLEVDTAMTGLYRVTDLTAAQYDQLYADMISASKEYGATLTDTINATSDWVRAGFDANTALGLADVTAMYQHVADLDYDEASKNLLTAYKGFEQNFTQNFGTDVTSAVEHVADVYNELDNKFSVTSAGLGESLARSASALQLAGNTFEESAALAGAATEVNQDPEKTGTALKTLSLRIRGMKGELEELGEDTEGIENISQMQGRILNMTKGTVNIFDDNGDFKSTYEIMKGIAEIYDDLSSTDQAELLETIAGKNHANTVAGLISNFDTAIEMNEAALNSEGSAARENEKYIDSLQGRIDVLTSSFQALSTSALNSDFLKGGVSSITALVDVFTSLVDTVGLLPTLLAAAGAGFSVFGKGIVTVDKANSRLQIFGKSLGDIKGILGSFASGGFGGGLDAILGNEQNNFVDFSERLEKDKAALQRYQDVMNSDEHATTAQVNQALSGASDELRQYVNNTEFASQSVEDFSAAQRQQFVELQAQNRGFKSSASILREYNNGCRNVGMTQAQFAEAVGKSNPVMGSYLSGLNGAQASMGGYAASLIGATAKTVGLTVASTALNAVLTMGIGLAIGAAITGIMSLINHESELADTVMDATTSFKQQHDELTKNKSSFDDAAASYAKLADGVNSITGKNMSLTPDEYEEYLNAVNTIADMTPSLVSGYDEQGNAILNAAGNVDALTEAYNNLIIAENNKLLNGDGEDYKGVSDISEDLKNSYKDIEKNVNYAELLNDVFDSGDVSTDNIINKIGNDTKTVATKVAEAMKDANKEIEGVEPPNIWTSQEDSAKYLSEVYKQYPNVIRDMTNEVTSELDSSVEPMRDAINAHMENAFLGGDYESLDSEMQSLATSLVSGLDSNLIAQLNSTGGENAVFEYIDNILGTLDGMGSDAQEKLKSSFNLQNLFNSGEISLGEYERKLNEISSLIDELGLEPEVASELKLSLNIDDVQEQYDTLLNRLSQNTSLDSNAVKKFVDSLSSEDFNILMNMELNGIDTIDELQQAIDLAKAVNGTIIEIDIDADTETLNNLNDAMSASKTAAGLTAEQIQNVNNAFGDLDGYDSAKMFEETANGIRLNTQEFEKFSEALTNGKLKETDEALKSYKDSLDALDDKIRQARMSGADNVDELISQREELRETINATAQYASQLQGLTSAYNDWQNAESAGSDRDMYESIISGFESIDDEISRGWLDDATKEFIELMTFDESSLSSIDDYVDRWNQLDDAIKGTTYSVRDFFTTNEDGESTNNGVYNFLDAVDQLNDERFKIERNENGVITSFDFGVNGDAAIAEAMGISEELVQIILRASEDAGFVINLDGAYTQLADLKEAAAQAAIDLKEIGKTSVDFTFDTSDSEKFVAEMDEAKRIWESYRNEDGSINWNLDGAEEAVTLYSTLVAQADKLSDPVYMQLDASQVDEELQEPLRKMQEYDSLLARKHQIEINGGDTSEVIADMEDIVSYLDRLDDEKKVKLGIDGMSRDELTAGLEQGTIEIPASVDIQVEMSDNIEDIRMALLKLTGAISDEEYQLYIDARLNGEMEVQAGLDEIKEEASTAQETLNSLSDKKYDFNFDTTDMADLYSQIDKAKGLLDQFRNEDGTVDLSVEGASEAQSILRALLRQKEELNPPVLMQVEIEDPSSDVGRAMTAVQNLYSAVQERNINIAVGADTTEVDSQINRLVSQITALQQNNPELYASLGLDTADFNNALSTLSANIQAGVELDPNALSTVQSSLSGINVDVFAAIAGLDTSMVDEYQAPQKEANAKYNVDSSVVDQWQAPDKSGSIRYNPIVNPLTASQINKTGTITYSTKLSGAIKADGTAHANGTAFARGNWATKDSGTALVGELGQETVVRDGRFFTIGDNGAEFFNYKKGDIIFNHKQTEELFKNGYVTSNGGRGRAYAYGTAFSSGSGGLGPAGGGSGWKPAGSSSSSSSSKKNTSSTKSSAKAATKAAEEAADEFEETFDFIEILIDRVERAIESLNRTASSTFKTWTERTNALNSQIAETSNEIDLQQKAYNRYIQQANSVGLSSDWASKVQSGQIDINTITDEDLANKIKEYQDWYEKALDCKDAIDELRESESELYNQRFENVSTKYDGILGVIQHEQAMLEESVSQSEAKGYVTSTKYYDALIKNQQQQTEQLKKQRQEMLNELQSGMSSGTIKKNSETWYEQVNAINEVTQAIEEGSTAILEYQNNIREINWQVFDLIQEQISSITSEADFLIDLMSNEKLFENNGKLTDEGKATMGMHGLNYNVYMAQADKYREEVEKLNKEIAKDPYDQDLINRRNELLDLQRESILNAEDEKNAIKDLVEEGIEKELDALQELIDKRNEALESQKDMYDYQKKVQEQVDDIASLEKQLAALSGDDSEEAKSKKQQLKDQLSGAREDLEETEMDKSISDQQALMDQLYTEYETILNTRLDNIDALVSQVIDGINSNSALISDTIREQADSVGYTLSDNMRQIWDTSNKGTQDVLSYYGDNFINKLTTTNSVLNTINTNVLNMITQLNKIATTKVNGASSSNASNSSSANTKPATPSTPAPTPAPSTPVKKTVTVGGQVNAGSARIYATSNGTGGGKQYYSYDPVYTVLQKKNGYVLVRWHKLSSGYTGWFRESDVKALKTGKRKMLGDDVAWTQDGGAEMIVRPSDGAILTPLAKNDSVLNARASGNIWNMANNPAEFIRDNLGTSDIGNAAVGNGGNTTYTQNFENVVFSLPNVKNYEQLLASMQKDKNFERLVQAMTIDRVAGKSSLAKGKAIR